LEKHGVFTEEIPLSVLSPASPEATIPVVFGTAPINRSAYAVPPVNKPILCNSFAEAVAAFGYSSDFDKYTLSEFVDSHFQLYGQSPAVLVNVLDPVEHKTSVAPASVAVAGGMATIDAEGILLATVVVKSQDDAKTYVLNTDYTLAFKTSGRVVLAVKSGGTIPANTATLKVSYDKLNPAAVEASDIIGGVDATSGDLTGLELIQQVFPRYRLVTGLIVAPKYSQDPTVAAVMTAKATNINGHFKAIALTDIPTDTVTKAADVPGWKTDHAFTSELQVNLWPKVKLGGKVYHMSTHAAGVICATDAMNGFVPSKSASNKPLKIDGAVLQDGKEILLGTDMAQYLNAQGIVTALNFIGGWKLWGNRSGAFPDNSAPTEAFTALRRMFNWISNTIVLTYWKYVDDPANKRLVEAVTDSLNIWLNGLQASEYILGGRVEFLKEENPAADLMNGKLTFHVFITPPSPAQELAFKIEYDPQYLAAIAG